MVVFIGFHALGNLYCKSSGVKYEFNCSLYFSIVTVPSALVMYFIDYKCCCRCINSNNDVVKMMHIVIFEFVLLFMNFFVQLFDDANIGG